jgi:chromosome segregation ATPase
MFDTMTIVLFVVALSAVAMAVFAIGYLSSVKRRLSELGIRVLESEDIGKIKSAANKAESYETRMAGCEHNAEENQNKIAVHETKLSELANKLGESEQKMSSFKVRFDEVANKLESVEQMANKNEDGLAQTVPNIKGLADEIQSIKSFQTATEKIHSLIQTAFDDLQVAAPPENVPATIPEAAKPEDAKPSDAKSEEASQGSEEWQEVTKDQKVSGSSRWQF